MWCLKYVTFVSVYRACQLIKGCDPKLVESILHEVIPSGGTGVGWGEVAGQVGLVLRRARQQSPAQAGVIIEQVSWDWWR